MNKVPQSFIDFINTSNLVRKKDLGDGMFLLKYRNKVFYDNLWTDELEECRGLILDKDYNIVQMPFRKIYNYGIERKAPTLSDDTMVKAYKKVNGFMGAVTYHNGSFLFSTTGSTDSNFAKMFKQMFLSTERNYADVIKLNDGHTFLFECVHPDDPHIIPENVGIHLIGRRAKKWGSKVHPFGEATLCTLGELRSLTKEAKHEGYVFYTTEDGISSKLKSPYYLTKKFLARSAPHKLLHAKAKQYISEEYYPLIDHIKANKGHFAALTEQDRLDYIREFLHVNTVY